jgi:hypothetical protein
LKSFLYVLTYGRNKYKDITRNIEGIYIKKPFEIYKLLTAVIVEKVIAVREIAFSYSPRSNRQEEILLVQ